MSTREAEIIKFKGDVLFSFPFEVTRNIIFSMSGEFMFCVKRRVPSVFLSLSAEYSREREREEGLFFFFDPPTTTTTTTTNFSRNNGIFMTPPHTPHLE
jgi:site-specific DNA-adenine methylase